MVVLINQIKHSQNYKIFGTISPSSNSIFQNSENYVNVGALKEKSGKIPQSSSYYIKGAVIPSDTTTSSGIIGISPSSAYNSGDIAVEIQGFGFKNNANVFLSMVGEENVNGKNVIVESQNKIYCTFNLTGIKSGFWTINVINPDNNSAVFSNAFEIKTFATAGTIINYPNPFNPLKENTNIIYDLEKDMDTTLLIFNISAELIYKQNFVSGTNGGKSGMNNIAWNGINSFGEMCANGIYFARLIDSHSGKTLAKGKIAVSK